jgi:hypothetical protein
MLVHARAPLSPIGRRRVVDRVVVEGWSVTEAAAGPESPTAPFIGGWPGSGPTVRAGSSTAGRCRGGSRTARHATGSG